MRLLILLTALLLSSTAFAQLNIRLKPNRKQFVAYEPIQITAYISNLAGRPITLSNRLNLPWIEFYITNHVGKTVTPLRRSTYSALPLPTGQTVSSSFTLNNSFNLTEPGNYSVYAIVRMPGQSAREGSRSSASHFSITKGLVAWSQPVGVPGTAGDQRKYKLIKFRGEDHPELYLQIEDIKRGRIIATYSLGRHIPFRKFSTAFDSSNNLNVLFQTTPALACHTVVNPSGKVLKRGYHKNASVGAPRLITDQNGIVSVINSIPYDPQKEAAEKAKFHGISEIPGGIQQ